MNLSKYFAKRQKTYPQNVKGKFRSIKNFTNLICLSIFFFFPFIRWDRGQSAPNQAILIDIPNSRGYFFFIDMWPEEVYYLAAILIFAAVALFFVTSLFGRVWCGYSCPQTVWTDLFIKVERFFQGDRNDRIKLDRKTFAWQNIWRKIATHLTWLLIGFVTGIGFIFYFNDAPLIVKNLLDFNLTNTQLGWALGIALATYIMAGFAREQVCNYMCPYSRFQSAMFDPDTLIISYDKKRGEPRGKIKKGADFNNRGHCIDCKQCVVVCPQNIDIRDGLQMECIACGLCIDACDNVMEKMSLPKGLIRYDTEFSIINPQANRKKRFLRPRTFYYSFILLIVAIIIIYSLASKAPTNFDILPDRNPLFVQLSNGDIRNGYTIKISNKSHQNKSYRILVENFTNSKIKSANPVIDIDNLQVNSGEVAAFKIYVAINKDDLISLNGRNNIIFSLVDKETNVEFLTNSVFISK